MARIAPILLLFVLSSNQIAPAADRTLAAEGDYVAHTKSGDKPLSHWQLWHLNNGEYEVVDANIKKPSSVQVFRFDAQFLPIGFIKRWEPITTHNPNLPKISGWTISCQYGIDELSCHAKSSEGKESTTSIPAKPPYVFIGEFYDLDFAWFMTGAVRLASRGNSRDGVVSVYALTDGAKPGDIGLKPDAPLKISFMSEETAQVIGETQVVKKYEWGSNDIPVLRVTAKGLVVSLSHRTDPAIGFGISGYKEYESWGPTR